MPKLQYYTDELQILCNQMAELYMWFRKDYFQHLISQFAIAVAKPGYEK